MSARRRIAAAILSTALLLAAALLSPGAPWSAYVRHHLDRLKVRADIGLARLRGRGPEPISLRGRLNPPGAKIEALNSSAGWAALSDANGEFTLPGLMWYPGASFELLIHTDESRAGLVRLDGPVDFPESGIMDVGSLGLDQASAQTRPVESGELYGITSITHIDYDSTNSDYYKHLFDQLTEGLDGDGEKLEAVNKFVASKLNYDETAFDYSSPREIMERGSRYCGNLCLAMATLLRAGGYRSRILDLTDAATPPTTHVLVEAYFDGAWRLYDPTFDLIFLNDDGSVCTYRDLRLNPRILSDTLSQASTRKSRRKLLARLPAVYESGLHHFYQFRR